MLEVAQLDDLGVDRQRRDRIQAGRRLVVEQDARPRRQRARDRHAPPLPARQFRRHAVARTRRVRRTRAPRRRARSTSAIGMTRLLEQAVARRSRARSASRTARLPETPCRGSTRTGIKSASDSRSTRVSVDEDLRRASGFSRPRISRRIVDLPAPLAPRMIFMSARQQREADVRRGSTLSSNASDTSSKAMTGVGAVGPSLDRAASVSQYITRSATW